MYEESKKVFNWKGFLIKLVLLFIVIVLVIKLLPLNSKEEENGHSKIFNTNFTKLKEVGNDYFTQDNLSSDEEVKVTLGQLINSEKISTLKGKDKKVCDEDASYIKAYKKSVGYELEVYLECGDENDTSYIYLGCYDDCTTTTTTTTTTKATTKKTTTTTKKASSSNSSSNSSNKSSTSSGSSNSVNKTTTTTTTTSVKKYAVIFNVNGGSKVSTKYVKAGQTLTQPDDPVKEGFEFVGWYLNGEKFDFSSSINSNLVLIAKWEVKENLALSNTKTYSEILYSVITANKNNTSISTTPSLNVPQNLKNYNNVKLKSLTYVKNITDDKEVNAYLNTKTTVYVFQENLMGSTWTIKNFGSIDNIEMEKKIDGDGYSSFSWGALVSSSCSTPVNNNCAYGIVYRAIWEYTE
jgi:hypothetical protein